jgi:hypothetical protein
MTQYVSPVMRRFDGYPEQWLYPATDEWTVGGGQIGTGTGTQALTANTALVFPVFIDRPLRVMDVGIVVTAEKSDKSAMVALYEFDPATSKLGKLVFSTEALSVGATGLVRARLTQESDGEGGWIDVPDQARDIFKAGWYAWAVVSDDAPTVRLVSVPDIYGGLVKPDTTNLTAINHYSVALTTPIASGYPADASDKTLTAVTSTSAFTKNQGVLALVKPLTV